MLFFRIAFFFVLLSFGSSLFAQRLSLQRDTLCYGFKQHFLKEKTTLFVAAPLMTAGLFSNRIQSDGTFGPSRIDRAYKSMRTEYACHYAFKIDDFTQFAPMAAMFGMKLGGVKSASSWGRMITADAFSAATMALFVNSIKYSAKKMRPDSSKRNSFPSGHTATSFMTASMFYHEYGHLGPWVGITSYSLATGTGIMRMLNNRHWLGDVFAGAGIGILSTELGYAITDLIFKERGHNDVVEKIDSVECKPSFVSISFGNSVPLNKYNYKGTDHEVYNGACLGLEGAWFMLPWLGVGGSTSLYNMPVGKDDFSYMLSYKTFNVGPYFAVKLPHKFMFEGNSLFGYVRCKGEDAEGLLLGKSRAFDFSAGLGLRYAVTPHFSYRLKGDWNIVVPRFSTPEQSMNVINTTLGACMTF